MGSRQLPTDCRHGSTIDWGDFGPSLLVQVEALTVEIMQIERADQDGAA